MAFEPDILTRENFTEILKADDNVNEATRSKRQGVTPYLLFCVMIVATGGYQMGYNLSSFNSCTYLLKSFISSNSIILGSYSRQLTHLNNRANELKHNQDMTLEELLEQVTNNPSFESENLAEELNMTLIDWILSANQVIDERKKVSTDLEKKTELYWAFLNSLFVVGCLAGSLSFRPVLSCVGQRRTIAYHNIFSIVASVLVLIVPYVKSAELLVFARFLSGYQTGVLVCVSPIYLSEIAPIHLRGQISSIPQIVFTSGVITAQVLAFKQVFGRPHLWHLVIAFPLLPALLAVSLIFLLPDSPVELVKVDELRAKKTLQKLRNSKDVDSELQLLCQTVNKTAHMRPISMKELLTKKELRWPLIISIVLTLGLQFTGINSIFFYSAEVFKNASIPMDMMQYAILSTGIVMFFTSIVCTILIERVGRKILLAVPMALIMIDLICLTIFLALKDKYPAMKYLCVVCVLIHLISFSLGIGPISAVYPAECFRPNVRPTVAGLIGVLNWINSSINAFGFPLLIQSISQYVFLIYVVLLAFALAVLVLKMVESKGKTSDEILSEYNR